MVQKNPDARRGRPRKFDEQEVLGLARDAFWQAGYQATSVEILSEATGLNRPSLYGAFGDKRALFLQVLETYRTANLEGARQMLEAAPTLHEGLRAVFEAAIGIYAGGPVGGRGCLVLGTVPSEALSDEAARAELAAMTSGLDALFAQRFRRALAEGDAVGVPDPKEAGRLATSTLHSLSVRARGGEKRAALVVLAKASAELLAPSKPAS